ncbi:MAG: hypothetical protein ACJ75H_14395 [Thermoanaerobaculia bacterium]
MTPEKARFWAKIGITAQFAAVVRTLAEYFRLRHVAGAFTTFSDADPWILGCLIAAVLCWLAVTAYFFERYRTAIAIAAGTIAILIAYKLMVLP